MAMVYTTRIGSSKMMRRSDKQGEILMIDRGFTSVFDRGPILDFQSKEIAAARTSQAVAVFKMLKHYGVPTHFIAQENETALRVKESRVNDLPLLSGFASAKMLGVEVLCRLRASKKFCDRFVRGEVPESKLLLHTNDRLKPGTRFAAPLVEFSTKWQPGGDVYLSDVEAGRLTESSEQDIHQVIQLGIEVCALLDQLTYDTGYELYDFKFEVAKEYGPGGRFCIIDGITLDEMVLEKEGDVYGKNPIRFYYEQHHPEWVIALKAAKLAMPDDKDSWPEYPPLPPWRKNKQIEMYQEVAEDMSDWVTKNCG